MSQAAVGISCMGPPGGKQGYRPYPSGPSQLMLIYKIGRSNAPNNFSYLKWRQLIQ
jgi:hypothetical protein